MRVNRAQGCLLGQLAGDALGSLVEFQSPKEIRRRYPDGVRELADGGTWNTIAGQPTDDSEMALLLARMLTERGTYDPDAALQAYQFWLNSDPFDCGMTIVTNILLFEKGGPTKEVWFFEHPYPEGYKSYSRSKPLTIGEFDLEKAWWGGAERKGRKVTEQAWKVSAKEIVERNYNLDCKNPHEVAVNHRDPQELMAEYQQIVHQLEAAQAALKVELMACLGGKA